MAHGAQVPATRGSSLPSFGGSTGGGFKDGDAHALCVRRTRQKSLFFPTDGTRFS